MTQFPSMQVPPRLPLVVLPSNRAQNTNKDAKLVNCYIETDEQGELWIYKRPGLLYSNQPPGGASTGAGLFTWENDNYAVFGSVLYRNGVSVGTGLDTTGGVYQFSSILGATPKMVLGNGKKAYAYTVAGGLTADLHSIDIDFPETFVKGWAYLNGPQYVMNPQAIIWGSAINAVSNAGDWDPLNFIAAQSEPDPGIAINKQLVYVIAFNGWSTEVFFDAGNPTGSPLGAVQGSKVSYGCVHADSVQSIDTKLMWLSRTQAGSVQVAQMEGLNVTIVSTKAVDRLLQDLDYDVIYSLQVKFGGHSFYIVTMKNSNITLAYDIAEDQWHQWADTEGNYFPYVASATTADNRHLFQHETNGSVYEVAPEFYNDNGSIIVSDIYTPLFDASTRRVKVLSKLEIIADQVPGSVLKVRKSDDDYQTWSNFRQFNLGNTRPILNDWGSFNKRAFHFRHDSNTPFRIQAVEVQYDIGVL